MTHLLTVVTHPASVYLVLFGLLVADALIPVVPTQALMISAGALTVYGRLDLPAAVAVGMAGQYTGDLCCYLLGRAARSPGRVRAGGRLRRLRDRLTERLHRDTEDRPRGTARRAAARFTRGLRTPGPLVLLVCRFVPGGRMVANFRAGRLDYPYRRHALFDGGAALGWATYGGLVGHLGGTALVRSAWHTFALTAVAALIFGTAGWLLALAGGATADRGASAGGRPRRSTPTATDRS
jgi:membrane-associated protein